MFCLLLIAASAQVPAAWTRHEGHPGWRFDQISAILKRSLATSVRRERARQTHHMGESLGMTAASSWKGPNPGTETTEVGGVVASTCFVSMKNPGYPLETQTKSLSPCLNSSRRARVAGWLQPQPPDLVTIHLGTNGMWARSRTAAALLLLPLPTRLPPCRACAHTHGRRPPVTGAPARRGVGGQTAARSSTCP